MKPSASRSATACLILLLPLLAGGCSQVVLHAELGEKEANEMMAILMKSGLSCTKVKGEESKWQLQVPPAEFAKAVAELRKQGYPKDRHVSIGEVFKKSGLVSSPTEERIRLMHGLSQELADTISQIDGVLTARVHIVLPNNNPFGENVQPASAAVFIKHRPNANLDSNLPQITKLVAGSIEGLKYENVSTVLTPAEEPPPEPRAPPVPQTIDVMGLRMAPDSAPMFWAVVGGLGAFAVLNLAVLAVVLIRSRAAAKLAEA